MNHFQILIFIALILNACANSPQSDTVQKEKISDHSLKECLEKYNGYYSEIENQGGTLTQESLPLEFTQYKNAKIESIELTHLGKIQNGYHLLFNIDFSGEKVLFVCTLNEEYLLVDYRKFPNGSSKLTFEKDTIALPVFSDNQIEIQLMHPNLNEVPSYKQNGIKKVHLKIDKDLRIEE